MPALSIVSAIQSSDPDPNFTPVYSLIAGVLNNDAFSISSSDLIADSVFNYEVQNQQVIQITANDGNGCSISSQFTITIVDTTDTPTDILLSNNIIGEDLPIGTTVGQFSTIDEDSWDAHAYTLVAGAGDTHNIYFTISGDTLSTDSVLDYENIPVYSIRVRSTDLGNAFVEKVFTISLLNENDPPTMILLSNDSITENLPTGSVVGTLSAIDMDVADVHVFTLINNVLSNSLFQISGNQLLTADTLDFETQSSHTVLIKVTDSGNDTLTMQFVIGIRDSNDVPTNISLSSNLIFENQPAGILIGNFSSTDQDTADSHTYTFVNGPGDPGNASFTISGNQLFSADTFHFAVQDTFSIRVRSTDLAGTFTEKVFEIIIRDENDAPTDIIIDTLWIQEGNSPNSYISKIQTVDLDVWDIFTYQLVGGTGDEDNDQFEISGDNLYIKTMTNFDIQTAYNFRVRSVDSAGAFVERGFVLQVNDIAGNSIPLGAANYISPNGDGKNDYWKIPNVELYDDFSLTVFNEHGQTVYFKSDNYDNTFDGKYNGDPLPTGSYYYVFTNPKSGKTFKGLITIVK
jgi:gliding motility-associated-like protein